MLTKQLQSIIEEIVRKSFNRFRLNLLGPDRVNKAYVLTMRGSKYDPHTSVASAYLHANALNTTDPNSIDKKTIGRIKDVAEKYIDQLEEKTVADVLRIISTHVSDIENEAKISGSETRDILLSEKGDLIIKSIKKELAEQKKRIDKAASIIAEHELHNAQNYGAFDGVLAAARSVGISDPTIVKIGVRDAKRCRSCWNLWTLPDKKTPKAYKLSELSAGPGHWKNPEASISPTHPNCFTEGRVPVLTDGGWKAIKKIKIGDRVLTHTGRFKTVIGLINEPYANKDNIIIKYKYNGRTFKHHVTPDHKFLTNRGWVQAADLTISDKFVSLKYPSGNGPIKDAIRDEWLRSQGWTVLRYGYKKETDIKKDQVIGDIQNALNSHDGHYSFDEIEIVDIKKAQTGNNGRVYCLTVEEDHSFIARGVVSSNCRDVIVTIMPGFGFDESGKIVYKGKDPETGEPWDEYSKQRK